MLLRKAAVVLFAYRPYKSGATNVTFDANVLPQAFWATQGVAGSMRREETKCKKPLVGTQLPATVQPNPFEPPRTRQRFSTPLLAWDQAVGSALGHCWTNTSLTVHRPALTLSTAGRWSLTTCDSLTGQRLGVPTQPNRCSPKNRSPRAAGADSENVDCWPLATVPTYQSVGVRPQLITVVAEFQLQMWLASGHTPPKPAMPSLALCPTGQSLTLRGSCAEGIQTRQ